MSCQIDDWKASASGFADERVITVTGDGECTTGGHKLRLEPTEEGVFDDPDIVALKLVVEEPEAGPEVITPVHVETEIKGDPAIKVRLDIEGGSRFIDVESG
jgi:hypothetical protein